MEERTSTRGLPYNGREEIEMTKERKGWDRLEHNWTEYCNRRLLNPDRSGPEVFKEYCIWSNGYAAGLEASREAYKTTPNSLVIAVLSLLLALVVLIIVI